MIREKPMQYKEQADVRSFIRLQLGGEVARAASHIRSKRAASLRAGIEESRREYQGDYGDETVAAFLECVELWLTDRGNMVAAAALRTYLETELCREAVAETTDTTEDTATMMSDEDLTATAPDYRAPGEVTTYAARLSSAPRSPTPSAFRTRRLGGATASRYSFRVVRPR